MKAYFKTCFVLLFLLFNACNDDSVTRRELPDPTIVGQWNNTDIHYSGTALLLDDNTAEALSVSAMSYDEDLVFDFQENPNILTSEGVFQIVVTISGAGISEEYYYPNTALETSYWSISGDLLTTEFQGEPTLFNINVLTQTNLVLSALVPINHLMDTEELSGNMLLTLEFDRL